MSIRHCLGTQNYEGNSNTQLWPTGSFAVRRRAAPTGKEGRSARPRPCRRRKPARLEGTVRFVERVHTAQASTHSRVGRVGRRGGSRCGCLAIQKRQRGLRNG
jgi:hypothetical protein